MLIILLVILVIMITFIVIHAIQEAKYEELENKVLKTLGFANWSIVPYYDAHITVKSRQTLEKYDSIKFFKENREKLVEAEAILARKKDVAGILNTFLGNNEFVGNSQYNRLKSQINSVIEKTDAYRIHIEYISSAGNHLAKKTINIYPRDIDKFYDDPSLLMGKGEYTKYLKEQQKEALSKKHQKYYEKVNSIIDYANENRDALIIKGSQEQLDKLIAQLFDRTVNSIKKSKLLTVKNGALSETSYRTSRKKLRKLYGKI